MEIVYSYFKGFVFLLSIPFNFKCSKGVRKFLMIQDNEWISS